MNNNLVSRVSILSSNTFHYYANVYNVPTIDLGMDWRKELQRIQPNDFANAGNLENLVITGSPLLRIVPQNVFICAPNLITFDLRGRYIKTLHEATFTGLSSLRYMFLNQNAIRELPVNVFRPLTSLELLALTDNQIESIDARLFEANSRLFKMRIARNGLNAIDRNILNVLPNLMDLLLIGNRCVNENFLVDATTIESVRQE